MVYQDESKVEIERLKAEIDVLKSDNKALCTLMIEKEKENKVLLDGFKQREVDLLKNHANTFNKWQMEMHRANVAQKELGEVRAKNETLKNRITELVSQCDEVYAKLQECQNDAELAKAATANTMKDLFNTKNSQDRIAVKVDENGFARGIKVKDDINNPSHYQSDNGIECIDAIQASLTPEEFRGYCKGNIMKYTWRERNKQGDDSLRKARWYINKLLGDV